MKCILLCAGYATRLFPLTENFPKALLEIGNKEILTHIIEKVNEIDIVDEIIIITNNKFYDIFNDYKQKLNNKTPITIINDQTNSNNDRLGVIGDIKYAISSLNINEEVILIAGDNLFDYSLVEVVDYYKSVNTNIVVCKQIEDSNLLKSLGVVTLDADKVIDFVEKPVVPISNIATFATYIFNKEVIDFVNKKENDYFSKDEPLIKYIYKDFGINAYIVEEECYDIGTHESLENVRKIYSE